MILCHLTYYFRDLLRHNRRPTSKNILIPTTIRRLANRPTTIMLTYTTRQRTCPPKLIHILTRRSTRPHPIRLRKRIRGPIHLTLPSIRPTMLLINRHRCNNLLLKRRLRVRMRRMPRRPRPNLTTYRRRIPMCTIRINTRLRRRIRTLRRLPPTIHMNRTTNINRRTHRRHIPIPKRCISRLINITSSIRGRLTHTTRA